MVFCENSLSPTHGGRKHPDAVFNLSIHIFFTSVHGLITFAPEMASAIALSLLCFAMASSSVSASNFYRDFEVTWGGGRARVLDHGELLTLSLDRVSGAGFQSRREYLFGKIHMQMKLVPGNSAGTVTAYYMSSQGPTRDEIDFEFLGNLTGDPYTLHTNVYSQGKGDREMQFKLWFDPTAAFHTYSVLWNPKHILFMVDGTPVREFRNLEARGVAFPRRQAMRIYSSLWSADDWATRGGLVKTDWTKAPFVAAYRGFRADACVRRGGRCVRRRGWWREELDWRWRRRMRWVQRKYMVYNYCTDTKRFPRGFPIECSVSH